MSEGLGSRTRIEAIVKPDTTFTGAHAKVFEALGLENTHEAVSDEEGSSHSSSSDAGRPRKMESKADAALTRGLTGLDEMDQMPEREGSGMKVRAVRGCINTTTPVDGSCEAVAPARPALRLYLYLR